MHNAGAVGHINAESGHGLWPEGQQLLVNLLRHQQFSHLPPELRAAV
ncbi:MAG: alpha/beta hydrolase [Aeromonadaceae bacterium]